MKINQEAIGFTLMEVLVALVILSVSFTAIYSGLSTNARALVYLQDKTAANWVALNVIAKYQLRWLPLQSINQHANGTEKMFHQTWYWNAKLSATTSPRVLLISVGVRKSQYSQEMGHYVAYLNED